MVASQDQSLVRIHELELLRQNAIHKTNSVTRDEEARLLQLRLLTMRDENSNLREKLGRRDFKISALIRGSDQLRLQLDDSKQTVQVHEARLRKQELDLNSLKTEIEALNGSRQDSGKALQEKFALARELDRIKPELEHLQSQLTDYQATVLEKNKLRRQLDSLTVELENERHAKGILQSRNSDDAATADLAARLEETERKLAAEKNKFRRQLDSLTVELENEKQAKGLLQSRHNDDAATADLTARLEETERKLAVEKKEREKARKEHERQLAAACAEKERLEERNSGLKEKSKTLQAELRNAKEQLEEVRSELAAASKARPVPRTTVEERSRRPVAPTVEAGQNRRAAAPLSFEDVVIQTPGNGMAFQDRPNKKRGIDKAIVGEKSAFSVTPFLKRNKSFTDDPAREESSRNTSSQAEPDSTASPSAIQEGTEEEAPQPKVSFKTSVSFQSSAEEDKSQKHLAKELPLSELTPAKANKSIKKRAAGPKAKSIPKVALGKAADDSSATDQENVSAAAEPEKPTSEQPPSKASEGDAKKRKRKLLGAANKTLFDEDDGEAVAQPKIQPATLLGGKRTKARLGGGMRNAFAAGASFSPLKRDRRGVNASFLV